METTLTTRSPAAQAYAYIRLSSQSQAWGDGERRQHGVRIGLTAQNVILDLASYAAFFPILADMMRSNSESEHKSFRSLANWQTKRKLAKEGVIATSQCPRWLKVRDSMFYVLEERAQLVRRIFEMYVEGYGRGVIARTLIKEGIPA